MECFDVFTLFLYSRVLTPVEMSQRSVSTTYRKDNTASFMHTHTVNKILDIKLSLWQNYIHKIFVPKSKRNEFFLFGPDGEQEGRCVFI